MRRSLSCFAVLGMMVATAGQARADEAPAPTPDSGSKMALGVGLGLWIPEGDADDFTDASLGVRPQLTYWIRPFIGVTATFDFVFVNEKDGVSSTTYYAISVGGRVTAPKPARLKPYGELLLGQYQLSNDAIDDGAIGFRIGGGATYELGPRVLGHAGLSYSAASIDVGGFFDVDVDAFILEVGASATF